MRRLARFLVRNWPLKIGAVGLAIILYGGMVVLQSTSVWPGTVAIAPVNQPANSFLLGTLPDVQNIRYVAASDVAITVNSFRATIDLSNVESSDSQQRLVRVDLTAEDPRIQIIDYQPQQIQITLDPIITKPVPVVVDTGTPPAGLQPATPVQSFDTAVVKGAEYYVRTVAYAQAAVRIDASGLDVNEDVDLVAKDAQGNTVNNVNFDPPRVHVSIQIGSQLRTETVPVSPITINSPASGYYVTGVEVTPPIVEVEGQADALAILGGTANTKPISLAGATGDISVSVGLDLPAGVTAATGTTIQVIIHVKSPDATRTVNVGIVPNGLRSDLIYSFSTSNAVVTIGGAAAALNAFDTSTLTASVSVGDLAPGTYTVSVTVNLPAGIKLVPGGLNPARITVTVVNPATPTPSESGPLATPTPTSKPS